MRILKPLVMTGAAFASLLGIQYSAQSQVAAATAGAPNDSWYPSKYGAADTIGAANNMSAQIVRQAASYVKSGKVYSLAIPVDPAVAPRTHRGFRVTIVQPGTAGGKAIGPNAFTFNDDAVYLWQGLGTQLDGFGHAGIDFKYYNGVKVDDFVRPGGVTKFSIHEVPPIVTRGVVLDIAGFRGTAAMAAGEAINEADIEGASRRQKVTLRKGDVVLLHTGWMDAKDAKGPRMNIDEPGLGLGGARHLAALGVVAVGSDNDAVEVLPSEDKTLVMPVHQELLTRSGVYMLENIVTRELVRDQAWEFLFVLAAPRLIGTVQANVHPIAIH